MIINLINIRLKQLYREMLGIGLFRFIVLLGIGFLLFAFLYMQTSMLPNAIYASAIILLLISSIHLRRGDKRFLKISFNSPKWIYFIEYLLISLALLVFLLIHNFWNLALPVIGMLVIIIQFDVKKTQISYNTRIQKWIPDECFEWKSGVRKLLPFIISIWMIGISFSFFVGSVPIALFILGIITLNFSEKGEPYQMILAFEKEPNKFLLLKIKQQLVLLSALSAPLILSFIFFHSHLWYIPCIIFMVFSVMQVYAILLKYAFYEPNIKSAAAPIFLGIGFICLIIPIFAPLIILLSLRFYFRAKNNLSYYLND